MNISIMPILAISLLMFACAPEVRPKAIGEGNSFRIRYYNSADKKFSKMEVYQSGHCWDYAKSKRGVLDESILTQLVQQNVFTSEDSAEFIYYPDSGRQPKWLENVYDNIQWEER